MKQTKNIKFEIIENFIDYALNEDIISGSAIDLERGIKKYVLDNYVDEIKEGVADLIKVCKATIEDNKGYIEDEIDPSKENFQATIWALEDAIKPFK